MKLQKFEFTHNGKPVTLSENTLREKFLDYLKSNCFGNQCSLIHGNGVQSREFKDTVKRFFARIRYVQRLEDFEKLCYLLYPVLTTFVGTKK